MKPLTPQDLQAMTQLANTASGQRLIAWLRESRDEAMVQVLRCADEFLPACRARAAALDSIVEAIDTAPDTLRETEAQARNREDRHEAALVGEHP